MMMVLDMILAAAAVADLSVDAKYKLRSSVALEAPAFVSFDHQNSVHLTDGLSSTAMTSNQPIGLGDSIRLSVGGSAGATVDGIRILQHASNFCDQCRLEATDEKNVLPDTKWTVLGVVNSWNAYFVFQSLKMRHIQIVSMQVGKTNWDIREIVAYGQLDRSARSAMDEPQPTYAFPPSHPMSKQYQNAGVPPQNGKPVRQDAFPPSHPMSSNYEQQNLSVEPGKDAKLDKTDASKRPPAQTAPAPGIPKLHTSSRGFHSCVNDCNNRGRCQNGLCICHGGYAGFDCSIVTLPELISQVRHGKAYMAYAGQHSWKSAEKHCVDRGGHLASLNSQAEEEYVLAVIKASCKTPNRAFIGLTDEANEGKFAWTDGSSRSYMRWNAGEPSNTARKEHYVEIAMDIGTGGWNDVAITSKSQCHVCEFDTANSNKTRAAEQACLSDCSLHGSCNPYGGKCVCWDGWAGTDCSIATKKGTARKRVYSVVDLLKKKTKDKKGNPTSSMSVKEAMSHCSNSGGFLPTIANRKEDDDLRALLKNECSQRNPRAHKVVPATIPIGLSDFSQRTGNNKARFQWQDGATVNERPFARWAANEPNNLQNGEHCVVVTAKGWTDMACSNQVSCFACEFFETQPISLGMISNSPIPEPGFYCNFYELVNDVILRAQMQISFNYTNYVTSPVSSAATSTVDAYPGGLPGMSSTDGSPLESADPQFSAYTVLQDAAATAAALWKSNDRAMAITNHQKALGHSLNVAQPIPHNITAILWYQLGIMLMHDKRTVEALQAFTACTAGPQTTIWYECKYGIALARMSQGWYEHAYEELRQLPLGGFYPAVPRWLETKGVLLLHLGDIPGAMEALEEALNSDIEALPTAACGLAAANYVGRNMAEARSMMKACREAMVTMLPTHEFASLKNVDICAASMIASGSDRETARKIISEASAKSPTDILVAATQMTMQMAWGEVAQTITSANAYFQTLNRKMVQRPMTLVGILAMAHYKRNNPSLALPLFKELLRGAVDDDLPDPLANPDVRYAFARSVFLNTKQTIAKRQWTAVLDALSTVSNIMSGFTLDFAKDLVAEQCNSAYQARILAQTLRYCEKASKKLPNNRNVKAALNWAQSMSGSKKQRQQQQRGQQQRQQQQRGQQQWQRQQQQRQQWQRQQQQRRPPPKDYHRVLGVPRTATAKQIKSAYHKLAMKWHPDKHSGEKEKAAAHKKFTDIAEAYEALTSAPKKPQGGYHRAQYKGRR